MLKLAASNPAIAPVAGRHRRALMAKVHMAAKALGLAEDDYRAILRRKVGVASAKYCSDAQLAALVAEFERLGFRSRAGMSSKPRADNPIANKARALWISLHQLGAIDDPSEDGLEAFGRRQLGVERLQWADQRHGDGLLEALKSIAERHGWSQRLPARMLAAERIRQLKVRLVAAIVAKLVALDAAGDAAGIDRDDWPAERLEAAARTFGARLRAARKGGR